MKKLAKFLLTTAATLIAAATVKAATVVGPISTVFYKDEGVTVSTSPNTIDFVGSGVTVTKTGVSSMTVTITGGGGGGASSLEVFNNNDATRSSPTASISLSNAFRGTVSGSTYTFRINFSSVASVSSLDDYLTKSSATTTYLQVETGDISEVTAGSGLTGGGTSGAIALHLDPNATHYIHNQNTLQTGATYYVSSGTVSGVLTVNQVNDFGSDGKITIGNGSGSPGFYFNSNSIGEFSFNGTTFAVSAPIWFSPGGAIRWPDGTIQVSSPPAAATGDIEGVTAGSGLSGGGTSGTVTLQLDPNATHYIHNQNTLQSGATFYVSSGTVRGVFTVWQTLDSTAAYIVSNISNASSKAILVIRNNADSIGNAIEFQGYTSVGTYGSDKWGRILVEPRSVGSAGETAAISFYVPIAGLLTEVLRVDGSDTTFAGPQVSFANNAVIALTDPSANGSYIYAGDADVRLSPASSSNQIVRLDDWNNTATNMSLDFEASGSTGSIKWNTTSSSFSTVNKFAFLSTMTLSGGYVVQNVAPTSGQVLKFNGTNWAPGTDNSGSGGSGTSIRVEEGGALVVVTSTVDFGAGLDVVDSSGESLVTVDLTEASGFTADPQQIRFSTGGTQVAISSGANFIEGSGIQYTATETGNRFDLTIAATLGTSISASEIADGDHGDFTYSGGAATMDANAVALGTDSTGIYVASLTVVSPITLSGTNNVETAAPILSLNQNGGTDVTADLEEETHASEHQDGGADEISVTGLSGLLADRQKIQISTGGTEVAISSGINFIAGTNVTLSGAYSSANGRVDITINSSGGGGGGSSTLAVGTGTAANFTTNVTSPTAVISFLGDQFKSVANGTTNFITLNLASVTAQGTILAGSNITLTPGAGTLTIAASGSGSGLIVSSFSANYLPLQIILSTGTLGVLNSTSTRPMALFDSSTAEWADWQSIQFSTFATVGSTLKADIAFSMASATSGGVTWGVQLEAITSGDSADFDTNSFDTLNSTSGVPVPATAGYFKVVTIPLTNVDSLAAGDSYRPRLWRLPADSGDTASGDAEFRWMRIYE